MQFLSSLQQRLHSWTPVIAVLAVGGALSFGVWQVLSMQRAQSVQERLEQEAYAFSAAVEQRMHAYADIVGVLRPLLEDAKLKATDPLAAMALTQEMSQRYPGAEALTHLLRLDADQYAHYHSLFLQTVPAGQRVPEGLMPAMDGQQGSVQLIDKVWPLSVNANFNGMDMRRFPVVDALLKKLGAGDSLAMSAPFSLQHTNKGSTAVVLIQPLKTAGAISVLGTQEGASFLGLSVNIEQLVQHLLRNGMLRDTAVRIRDADTLAQQEEAMFASGDWVQLADSTQRVQHQLAMGGRTWLLEFVPKTAVFSGTQHYFSLIMGLGGATATALLALVVGLLARQRLHAQLHAQAKHHLLLQRTERYNALFHQAAIGVAEIEPATGRYISANTRFMDIVGLDLPALQGMEIFDLIYEQDRAAYRDKLDKLRAGQLPHYSITPRLMRSDGELVWTESWVAPLESKDGKCSQRFVVLVQDISERRELQEQLQAREAYSSEMLRYMPVGLVVVGPLGNIEFVNHQFESMTGWSKSDLNDESAMWRLLCVDMQQHNALLKRLNAGRCEVVPTGVNMPAMEYLLRSKNGQEMNMEVSGRFLNSRILLSFVDVTQRKAAEAEIRWLGFYDTLTQLPNRRLLLDQLADAVVRSQKPNATKGALLLLDVDNFKALNETLGHQLGDALLRLVAVRLSHCIAGQHILARQGGDEFAVVLENLPADPLEAGRATEQVGRSILEALRAPFYLGGQDFHVTVCMGAVVFSGQADTVEELLKRADLALYQAKSVGRDTLQFFDPSMQKAVTARVEMEKDLRLALDRHEFDLFLQAQVQGDRVVGAEALLRWCHPTKSFIPPGVFVPIAEESGLILPLGEWVLFAACRQLAWWANDPEMAHLTMAVNVSPRQFYQPNFVAQVQQALQITGAKPELLELELTEGMLLTDVEDTIQKMVQLKALGVSFSLDDFGTGYSSLSYLKRLPLDKLKIDQSFVNDVAINANAAAITRSIIALGHSLGLRVIAEGVETQIQKDLLAASGCNYWQGFYFSRPQPASEFEAWTRAYTGQDQPAPSRPQVVNV